MMRQNTLVKITKVLFQGMIMSSYLLWLIFISCATMDDFKVTPYHVNTVNKHYGTSIRLNQIQNSHDLTQDVFYKYVCLYDCKTPQDIVKVWRYNLTEQEQAVYLKALEKRMAEIQFQLACTRIRQLYQLKKNEI